MEIRTVPRPTCFVCGSKGEIIYSDLKDRMFGVPGNWSLKRCINRDCGLCWPDPTPHEGDISLLYKAYTTHAGRGLGHGFLAYLRAAFYACYSAANYLPSTFLGLKNARNQIFHMFLLESSPGKLLDVGCGDGGFLHRMHGLGWSATGLDFDGKAIENAKAMYGAKLVLMHTDLRGAGFSNETFDAVTMNHVIEHVPDAVELLKEAERILKPGGKLVVTTPNNRSFGHKKFRDCWRGLETPRHLQIFSRSALQECARKAGLRHAQVSSTAANADIIIGGSFSFVEAKKRGDCFYGSQLKINFIRGIRSLLLQYIEAFKLRRDPDSGEELVLIYEK